MGARKPTGRGSGPISVEHLRPAHELPPNVPAGYSLLLGIPLDVDTEGPPIKRRGAAIGWPERAEYRAIIQAMGSGLFGEHARYNLAQRDKIHILGRQVADVDKQTPAQREDLAILRSWYARVAAYTAEDELEAARRTGVRELGRDPDHEAPTTKPGEHWPFVVTHKIKSRRGDE